MFDPFIVSSILLSVSFLVILVLNIRINNKFINYMFLIYSLIYLILIILLDNNFILEFLKQIITYIWYPSYLLFVITVIISIIIFYVSILNKNINILKKIINYLLFIISFSCYIIFIRLGIDPSIYSEYYKNSNIAIVRITTISFIIWIIINIIFKVRGKYEK